LYGQTSEFILLSQLYKAKGNAFRLAFISEFIEQEENQKRGFRRILSSFNLVRLKIGLIIGISIFVLAG